MFAASIDLHTAALAVSGSHRRHRAVHRPSCSETASDTHVSTKGVHVTAYSPLGTPDSKDMMKREETPSLTEEPTVLEAAKAHDAHPIQVGCLTQRIGVGAAVCMGPGSPDDMVDDHPVVIRSDGVHCNACTRAVDRLVSAHEGQALQTSLSVGSRVVQGGLHRRCAAHCALHVCFSAGKCDRSLITACIAGVDSVGDPARHQRDPQGHLGEPPEGAPLTSCLASRILPQCCVLRRH